jgi:nucleoid-associated protein YgaU
MRKRALIVQLAYGCSILALAACKALPHRIETPAAAPAPPSGETAVPAAQNPPESCYVQIPGGTALRQTPECASAAPSAPAATPNQPGAPPDRSGAKAEGAGSANASAAAAGDAGLPLPNLPPLARARAGAPPAAGDGSPAHAGRHATLAQARSALQSAQNRLNLSKSQLARLRQARERIDAGDAGGAMAILQPLNEQLASEVRTYTVRHGGSLRDVAARPQVYGNPDLWPLLWQANRERLAQPTHLEPGVRLIVPAHPTAAEVAQALEEARRNDLAQLQTPSARAARAN